ncbi:hypothetical protein BBJ28_00012114 [Nothophytophthora sp. Chile5]|nr:hypothetical protein BBJ28_00012114 [Nothophytophthora sp. Chile5]
MRLTMGQKSFDNLREFNIVKAVDYQYAPCGTCIFMAKEKADFRIYSDPAQIMKALGDDDEETTSELTENSVLQHMSMRYIVLEEETMARHEDLHCLALASAVLPASSSKNIKKARKLR